MYPGDEAPAPEAPQAAAELPLLEDVVVQEIRPAGLALQFPTGNDALLRDEGGAFYQALDATVPGLRPEGWMGGQYGFVRNVARTPAGPTFTRLHQGVDIRPVYRDARGEPQDTIRAIAAGTVAYVNAAPGNSSYGIYVVMRHQWEGSAVYSLYAHLERAWVRTGAVVQGGDDLGRMGWTGAGLAQHRAHLHLELALLMNRHYNRWHAAFYGGRNLHGLFFGRNLMGVDPAALYLALEEEPGLTFPEFVRRKPVAYRLAIPGNRSLDVLDRYPWLGEPGVEASAGAWVVSFTREGVPIGITRQATDVTAPEVVFVSDEVVRGHLSTNGYLERTARGYALTRAGRAHAALLATDECGVPRWF
jgi:murein DD-endopeptidase MepM/ murein hydrolase activator NlpD